MSKTIRKPNYQALLRMIDLAERHEVNMSTWVCFDGDEKHEQASFDGKLECEAAVMLDSIQRSYDFCSTVGCLAGTYTIAYPKSINVTSIEEVVKVWDSTGRHPIPELLDHLGISKMEFDWLFLWQRRRTRVINHSVHVLEFSKELNEIDTEAAVRRLRRFVYHKLKQEEIHEAWNSRYNTKHSQSENTNYVNSLTTKSSLTLKEELAHA